MEVMVPKTYKEVSTSKVLVMEFMDFIKITDIDAPNTTMKSYYLYSNIGKRFKWRP